jgi:hypothetical protein
MEVTVLDAQSMPKKPVLVVRAGTSLRHFPMAVNSPFHVPRNGQEDNRINVSLYEQLGTQTILDADEPESTCNVPVRTPDGSCSQVKLRIRRGQTSNGATFKSSVIGAEDYLNHHQLEARLQSLFEIVLKKQPNNPYRCMIEELRKVKTSGEEPALSGTAPTQSSAPKAPVAPAGPPPANARPSPVKSRNLKSPDGSTNEEVAEAETQAALAEIMKNGAVGRLEACSNQKQRSGARADAAKALSNLELAHEVMRLCIRNIVAKMAMQSGSLGNSRNEGRAKAIEHAKNLKISHVVMRMAVESAYTQIYGQNGGTMQNDDTISKGDPASTGTQ